MKTKEKLEEAIKGTIKGYKEIIFGSDTPVCMVCLDELRKQQIIDQHVYVYVYVYVSFILIWRVIAPYKNVPSN